MLGRSLYLTVSWFLHWATLLDNLRALFHFCSSCQPFGASVVKYLIIRSWAPLEITSVTHWAQRWCTSTSSTWEVEKGGQDVILSSIVSLKPGLCEIQAQKKPQQNEICLPASWITGAVRVEVCLAWNSFQFWKMIAGVFVLVSAMSLYISPSHHDFASGKWEIS